MHDRNRASSNAPTAVCGAQTDYGVVTHYASRGEEIFQSEGDE